MWLLRAVEDLKALREDYGYAALMEMALAGCLSVSIRMTPFCAPEDMVMEIKAALERWSVLKW